MEKIGGKNEQSGQISTLLLKKKMLKNYRYSNENSKALLKNYNGMKNHNIQHDWKKKWQKTKGQSN